MKKIQKTNYNSGTATAKFVDKRTADNAQLLVFT